MEATGGRKTRSRLSLAVVVVCCETGVGGGLTMRLDEEGLAWFVLCKEWVKASVRTHLRSWCRVDPREEDVWSCVHHLMEVD